MNLNQEKSMIGSMVYEPYTFLKRAIVHNDIFAFASLATVREITTNIQKMWNGEEVAIEIVNNLDEDRSMLRCVWGKQPSMKGYLPETLFLMNWLRAACEEAPQ